MDKFYTTFYKQIKDVAGFKIDIEGRWICCVHKDNIGKRGVEYTLVDNYSEHYHLRLDDNDDITINKGEIRDGFLNLFPKLLILLPLPDFAIDVLQTISHPVGVETLTRVAEVFKNKYRH